MAASHWLRVALFRVSLWIQATKTNGLGDEDPPDGVCLGGLEDIAVVVQVATTIKVSCM